MINNDKPIPSEYAHFGLNTGNMQTFLQFAPNKCQLILYQLSAGCEMFSQVVAAKNQVSISIVYRPMCKSLHYFPKFGSEYIASLHRFFFRMVPQSWASYIAIIKHQYSKTSRWESQFWGPRKWWSWSFRCADVLTYICTPIATCLQIWSCFFV